MLNKTHFFLLLLVLPVWVIAQQDKQYWVQFTEKNKDASAFENPFSLLSPRAIERRAAQSISFDALDLPVNEDHIASLNAPQIHVVSRWLNAVLVSGIDSARISKMPFVTHISPRIPMRKHISDAGFTYGQSALQVEMLKGDVIHNRGYTGQGVLIAVFDGGFNNAQNIPALAHLWQNNQIKGIYSFVNQDTNIFFPGSHGTHVLSVLAAKDDGVFVGTAPDADYWLFMTEDEVREVNAEEYNWLAAAEMSDSLGVDVINSSLGYSLFDPGQISYTLGDLDGQTSIVSQAAQFAARKGMLVVNSAGNSGSDPVWQKIQMPADADSVLAVGAVNPNRSRALFSSIGPTVDGRIKPDLMALGSQARYLTTSGFPTQGNGTSFASPLVAGLAACLRQAYPHHSAENLRQTILQSCDQYLTPDSLVGHGIPDFDIAVNNIVSVDAYGEDNKPYVYPNPANDLINVKWHESFTPSHARIFDVSGTLIETHELPLNLQRLEIDVRHLSDGAYFIHLYNNHKAYVQKFIKHGE